MCGDLPRHLQISHLLHCLYFTIAIFLWSKEKIKGKSFIFQPSPSQQINLGPSSNPHAKPSDFHFLKVIGKGSFGKVISHLKLSLFTVFHTLILHSPWMWTGKWFLRLDMASFDYQVLGLRTLKIVNLPPHPLPQANIPLFIKVLILSLLQELTVHCLF